MSELGLPRSLHWALIGSLSATHLLIFTEFVEIRCVWAIFWNCPVGAKLLG